MQATTVCNRPLWELQRSTTRCYNRRAKMLLVSIIDATKVAMKDFDTASEDLLHTTPSVPLLLSLIWMYLCKSVSRYIQIINTNYVTEIFFVTSFWNVAMPFFVVLTHYRKKCNNHYAVLLQKHIFFTTRSRQTIYTMGLYILLWTKKLLKQKQGSVFGSNQGWF
jgi:hypothetical protein